MSRHLVFAVLAFACGAAAAADVPTSSNLDNRIQYVNFNDGDVVVVRAVAGLGARIVFAPGEEILDVASGFTQGWEFADRRNILYVKPKSIPGGKDQPVVEPEPGKWDTNLMVTTNQRMYDFDLQLLPVSAASRAGSQGRMAYRVEFRYPTVDAAKAKIAADKAAAQAKLDVKAPPQNWNYTMQIGKNSDGIAPTEAYDDGRFTYLKFPNNRDFPSVFLVADDKTESLVNTNVENDVLVVQRVAKAMVLRLGASVVGVYNEAFDLDGSPASSGTTVPGVKRVIKLDEQDGSND